MPNDPRDLAPETVQFPFTHEICKGLSPEQRVGIIEMMWNVAYSDGIGDILLRQIAR